MHGDTDLLMEQVKVDLETGCWEWQGHLTKGYGAIKFPGRRRLGAHRAAWETFEGPIPEGLQIDHLCKNTRCVNTAHLEPVTPAENTRRALVKTHCHAGHELAGDNVRERTTGGRRCLPCNREAAARATAERQAARVLREAAKWQERQDRFRAAFMPDRATTAG